MPKPEHYTWDEWYEFSNDQFLKSQAEIIKQEEEAAKCKQKQMEDEAKLAKDLCTKMTQSLLPVPNQSKDISSKNLQDNFSLSKVKTEPGLVPATTKTNMKNFDVPNSKISTNGNEANLKTSEVCSEEKNSQKQITELGSLVKSFVTEMSDMLMDEDILFAICNFKKIGGEMRSSIEQTEKRGGSQWRGTDYVLTPGRASLPLDSPSSVGLLPPCSLDFSPSHMQRIKQESEQPPQTHRPMFPGAKRQTFEQFHESYQSKKRRLSSQSPAPATGTLTSKMGSPKGSSHGQTVDYASLTDSKVAVIIQGNDVLKRRRSSKICKDVWSEAERMNRVILDASDVNFYYLLSGFKPQYSSVAETLHAAKFKEDFFDYILENVSYTKVNSKY